MDDSEGFLSTQGTDSLKSDSHIWRTTMDAALRVHRHHVAKVEAWAAHSTQPITQRDRTQPHQDSLQSLNDSGRA